MSIDIEQASKLLLQGKIVAFPTETVYGLGALASDEQAVQAIFDIKHRPNDNPLICHFASASQIIEYTSHIPSYWDVLVSHFSPGAVSYLLPSGDDRLHAATRGSDKVLCRIPNHPLALQLLESVAQPLVGPSANISGHPSATNAKMVLDYFGEQISIVDGGSSWIGIESTIIDCTNPDHIIIYRPGQIGANEISKVLESSGHHIQVSIGSLDTGIHVVPGTKYRHYSPTTLIYKVTSRNPIHDRGDIALIGPTELLERVHTSEITHRIDLGSVYTPATIAHNLYHMLHELDAMGLRHAYFLMWKLGDSSIEQGLADRLDKVGEWRE